MSNSPNSTMSIIRGDCASWPFLAINLVPKNLYVLHFIGYLFVKKLRVMSKALFNHTSLNHCFQFQGTHEEILDIVETKFGAKDKFTWFEKGHVNGKDTREVYSFLVGDV